MPKQKKRGNSGGSFNSLARSISLLRSEVKENSLELREMRDEMRTGFDQIYRHIDGLIKLQGEKGTFCFFEPTIRFRMMTAEFEVAFLISVVLTQVLV